MVKICHICGIEKEISEFYKLREWYRNTCKSCRNVYRKGYLKLHPEIKLKMKITWREKHPEKQRCHRIFQYAIEKKLIERQSCSVCGDTNSHGHHDHYDKPFDVAWLCLKHHFDVHSHVERRRKCSVLSVGLLI